MNNIHEECCTFEERSEKQKFRIGDLVWLKNKNDDIYFHVKSDTPAIVMGSYFDKFGHGFQDEYEVHMFREGTCAWIEENDMILIERNRADLLDKWAEREARGV